MKNKFNFLIIICIAFISASGIYAENMKPVDLSKYYNGDGFSYANNPKDENFDGGGYSYPAEEFSREQKPFGIEEVVFKLPSVTDGEKNFYMPDEKEIKINAKADRLFILASSVSGDSFIEAEIKTTKRSYKIHFNVTDWARPPAFSEKIFTIFSGRHNSSGGDSHKPRIFFYRVFLKPPLKDEKIEWVKFMKQPKARIFALTAAFTEDYSMLAKNKKSPNDPNYFSFYPNSNEENYFLHSKGNSKITGAGTRYLYGDGGGVIYKFNFNAGERLKIKIHAEGAIEMSYSNNGSNYTDKVLNFIDNKAQTEITVDNSGKLFLKFTSKDKKDLSIYQISILAVSVKHTDFKMSGREDWIGFVSHYPVLKNGADLMPYTENSVIATRPAAWGEVEPKKDEFNFKDIDEMVEYAEKYDLYYVPMIEIDPCHTPKWLLEEIKARGEIQKDASTHVFNEPALHSKYFRERMKIVIKKTIEYMKKKDVNNRIVGYIAGAEWWYILGGRYQKVDTEAYKEWLREKYNNDIKKLSKAWGMEVKSFEEAKPIRVAYTTGFKSGENRGTANCPVRDYDKSTQVFIKGDKKYKIDTTKPLVFKAKVKMKDVLDGGITLRLNTHSSLSAPSLLYSPTIKGTHDWTDLILKDYPLPPERDTTDVEIHFTGCGEVWIDNLYLGPEDGSGNLLDNPDFEQGDGTPTNWILNNWSSEGKYKIEQINEGINGSKCIKISNSEQSVFSKKSDPYINKRWADFQEFGHDTSKEIFDYIGTCIKEVDNKLPVISYGTVLFPFFWGWDELPCGIHLYNVAKMKNMDYLGMQLPSHRGDYHPITSPLDIARRYDKPLYVMDLLDWTAGPEIGFDKMMRVAHGTLQHGANGFLTYCWFAPGGDYKFFTNWKFEELRRFNIDSRIARKMTQGKKINPQMLMIMPMLQTTYSDPDGIKNDPEDFVGWYKMLIQNQHYFDVALFEDLMEKDIDAKYLSKYEVIVIPDCAYINENIVKKLNEYLKAGGNIVSSARFAVYDEYGSPAPMTPKYASGLKDTGNKIIKYGKGKFVHVGSTSFYDEDKKRTITGGIGKAYLEKVRRYNLRWTTPPLFHVMDWDYKNENRTKLRKTVESALKEADYKKRINFVEDNPYVETVLFEGKDEDLIYFVFHSKEEKSDAVTVVFHSDKNIKSMEAVYDMEKKEAVSFTKKGNVYKFKIAPFKYACILKLTH